MMGNDAFYFLEETVEPEKKQGWDWNKILLVVLIGFIGIGVLSVAMGLLGFVIRYAFPIIIFVIVLQIFKRK